MAHNLNYHDMRCHWATAQLRLQLRRGVRVRIGKREKDAERPYPVADDLSEPFWKAANEGILKIQRCTSCRRFHFPATSVCSECASTELKYETVSGRGRVHSYTETLAGARHPFFASIAPYLVGLVELEEQEGLLMYTNFPEARLDDMRAGAVVEVIFERLSTGQRIPQFHLTKRGRS